MPFPEEKPIVGANRGDLAVNGGRRQARVLERVHERAELGRGEIAGTRDAPVGGVRRETAQIAQIGADGVRARPRLEREIVAKLLQAEGRCDDSSLRHGQQDTQKPANVARVAASV